MDYIKLIKLTMYTLFIYQNPCPQVECNDQRHIGEINEFVEIET